MHDRTEWRQGQEGTKVINGRSYKNLTEFTRPCAACGERFSIFVTEKIALGHADSNSFGLKNCEAHRRSKTTVSDDTLQTSNQTMREELAGLYQRDKEQFAEIQTLKARLAAYELQGAMVGVANGAQNKMPWE